MSFNHTGTYVCECGRTFNSSQSFNGHKSNCKAHHLSKYGNLSIINDKYIRVSHSCKNANNEKFSAIRQKKLAQWISEQHTCEKCGRVMTEKFGSGRFCSKACANSRNHTDEVIGKIKESAINKGNEKHNSIVEEYNAHPNYCKICGNKLDYEHRRNKTCSELCKRMLASINLKNNPVAGGLRKGSGTGKHGWYKGFFCDSTYELVYVIYNIDNGITFDRYRGYYPYSYKGKNRKYYPDFILSDGSLVEIKGYMTDQDVAKISSVKDRKISVLFKNDLKYAFDWVLEHYTYDTLEELYESHQ